MSEVILLPNTDRRQQVEDYLKSCTTSTKYWRHSTSLRIMSEVILLPNTDDSQQVEGLCQRLYYYQILTAVNKLTNYVRCCTSTKYWPQSTSWRIMSEVVLLPNTDRGQQVEGLCLRLYYYQILTTVNKLKNYVRGCTITKYWRSQQVEGLCQRLYTTTVKWFLSVYMFHRLVLDKGDNRLQPGDSTLLVVTAGASQVR
jgi:hypothetical protein